jgi:hypothetical protein
MSGKEWVWFLVFAATVILGVLVVVAVAHEDAKTDARSPLRHVAGSSYDGLMVFHDDARHVTCYAMHSNGLWCVMDSTLEREEEIQVTNTAAAIRARDGGTQ